MREQPVGGVFRPGRLRRTVWWPTKFMLTDNPDALRHRLPLEDPASFDLVIKPKVARALRLSIPPSLWLRADGVKR